jgi:hypothetical protein
MKIIDWSTNGNLVRFYLGEDNLDKWWGDDWNDTPYEHNAGTVYEKYVSGTVDVAFPFDWIVSEPCDGHLNSPWSKEDMMERKVPMLAVLPASGYSWKYDDNFGAVAAAGDATRFYMGDAFDEGALPAGAVVIACNR